MIDYNVDEFTKVWSDSQVCVGDIAKRFGVNRRTVYDWANNLRLPKVDRSGNKRTQSGVYWTEERIKEFAREYPSTDSRILAKKYGVGALRIRQLASEFGILKKSVKRDVDEAIEDLPTYEELMDLSVTEQLIMDKLIKHPEVVRIEIDTDKPIALTNWADLHLGHPGVDYVGVDSATNLVCETDGLFVYAGGDGSENFIVSNGKSAGAGLNQQQIVRQRALFIRLLQKLGDSLIALGSSSEHSGWNRAMTGVDDLAELAKRLNLVYTDVGGLIELTVGNQTYNIFRTHRYKYNSDFNLTHTAKQLWRLGQYDADITIVEHRHSAAIESFLGHGLERYAVRTGTAKVYDDYARKFGYYGQRFANPTIILYPNERRMIGFLHMEDAIITLKALRE